MEANPLGIYEPYKAEQLQPVKAVSHPDGGGLYVPSYSSWGAWDKSISQQADYSNVKLAGSSLIMSGVRWAGQTLPEAPLHVKETSGEKGESEVVGDHPLTELWRRPNDFYSGSTMMKGFAYSWLVKGDVYIRKIWNAARTRPVELWYEPHWTIRPRWLSDNKGNWIGPTRPDITDDPYAFINYYEMDRRYGKVRLEVDDVIHFRDGIDPETRCGTNGIDSILREIYGDNEAANYFGALMANSGVPKFLLSIDKELAADPEKCEEIARAAHRQTTGENRGKVIALTGVTPHDLAFSPDELDLRASRYMSEDRFAAVTGIPAVELELGVGREKSHYNNVRQASERATERFLVPTWGHISEELTTQLLPDFETEEKSVIAVKTWIPKQPEFVKGYQEVTAIKARNGSMRYVGHDLSKVRALQEDEDSKHERVRGDYESGLIDRAEGRSALNYPVRDEDKNFYSPKAGAPQQPKDTEAGMPEGQVKSHRSNGDSGVLTV